MADPKTPDTESDFSSSVDEMMDEDSEMYDDTGAGNDGGDDSGGDGGTGTGEDGANAPKQTQDEPSLPMALPDARAPATPVYDPDNPKGFARVGSLFADGDGNIVTRDGRVMAAKGEPARHWSNLSRQAAQGEQFKRQTEALTRQVEGSRQLIESAKELAGLPQRLGISREDYNEGVSLIANWNRDPLSVARDVVQRTLARGFNASDILGKTAGDALEMGAIRHLINEVVAPQRAREHAERVTNEQRTQAQQSYDSFITRYPDAAPHGDAIASLMREQKISATEAYHEVRFFALQNGLDFSQPLGPQVAAAQARAQQPNAVAPQGRTHRPMVAGNGGGNRGNLTSDPNFAEASSSWSDIINSVMYQS